MRKIFLAIVVSVAGLTAHAQNLIPGIEFAEEGTIYITDKDSVQGVLAFTYLKNNQVVLVGQKETKYKSEDVKGFYLRTSKLHFVSGTYSVGYKAFLQVETPERKKAKVVKTFVADKYAKIEPGIIPPGTWSISLYLVDKHLNFEATKKMAEALKTDCPELSAKLLKKDSGYFVGIMTLDDEKLVTFGKIMDELDAGCK